MVQVPQEEFLWPSTTTMQYNRDPEIERVLRRQTMSTTKLPVTKGNSSFAKRPRVNMGMTNREPEPPVQTDTWSPPNGRLTLPKTFGTTATTYHVETNKARIHQSTRSFEEHTRELKSEEKVRRAQLIEIEHRKMNESWGQPIGLKRPDDAPPSRFSVTPKRQTTDLLIGAEGTSFHERRMMTTKTSLEAHHPNPHAQEREVTRQREEVRLERIRTNQKRAELTVQQEDASRKESREQTIKSKADQRKSYMEAVQHRENRGGKF
ncbi:hypothetical protein PROFUN_07053 [Planoprotostelium fungivorum]|uniref:Uncharacterized protein n=1 Tax=Planoprotostelium fungivorum TaxID=1890364 RepID=A0A2P6NN08_9EUKA|nr:hypothetical protein PROFUN_07053 [Planoprotostelium fungivorum]